MADRPFINFQEVKDRVPIPEALEKLGLLSQFTRRGDSLTGICPIPTHQHGPMPNDQQFKVNKRDGTWLWHCFGDCNRGGDVIELVKAVKGFDDAHVRFWFAEHFSDRLSLKGKRKKKEHETPAAGDEASNASDQKPLRFYLNLDVAAAMPYLSSRGLEEATVRRYGVGLCNKGILAGYVAIPLRRWPQQAADENPLAYIGRWPGEDFDADAGRPRYKVPTDFETSRVLFGLSQALAEGNQSRPLLVVEGPLKCMWLAQRGFSVVSSFTASVSDEQAKLLMQTRRPIVLAFDGNEAGFQGMRTAAARLITDQFVRVVKLPEGKEPDELADTDLDQFYGFARH